MQLLENFGKIICWHPPRVGTPNLREILDPPLNLAKVLIFFINNICLTSVTRVKCGVRSTLCWKNGNMSGSYPCHASEIIRNILNHCLKFPLHCISCHICYRKMLKKYFSTVIKDKLLVSKASNSCFKGLDFFQMLLASHR